MGGEKNTLALHGPAKEKGESREVRGVGGAPGAGGGRAGLRGGAGSRGSSAVCRAPGENRQLIRALWAGNTPAPPRDTPLPPPPQRPTGMGCAVLFRSPPCSPFCPQRQAGTNSLPSPGTAPACRTPGCAGPPTPAPRNVPRRRSVDCFNASSRCYRDCSPCYVMKMCFMLRCVLWYVTTC